MDTDTGLLLQPSRQAHLFRTPAEETALLMKGRPKTLQHLPARRAAGLPTHTAVTARTGRQITLCDSHCDVVTWRGCAAQRPIISVA